MRASRGGSARRAIARPSSVMRPSASSAPIAPSSARASLSAARGGGSRKASRVGSVSPQTAQSSRKPERSADEDFRRGVGLKPAGRRLLPQPVADARLDAAGAAAPLVGVGARDAHRFEPRQADVGLVAGHAHEAAVDDDAHAFDGQRGLGDRGRQHDLPPPRRRRLDGAILGAGIKRAVERRDIDVGPADPRLQRLGDPADLALPRQEDESRARLAIERLERRAGDLVLDPRMAVAADIARDDGKGAALAFDQRGVAEQARAPARRRASPT